MKGYLDHLETTHGVGWHKKVWIRRFFKLNSTFHAVEFFTDETQHERKGRLELQGAVVVTADDLGELLTDNDKGAIEMSRRFIFRITEGDSKKHHYLCAVDASSSSTYASVSSARDYMNEWLHALRKTISAEVEMPFSANTMGLGELNALVGAFMNHIHLSAYISNRIHEHGKVSYETTVKAWVLERELVVSGKDGDTRSHENGSGSSGDMSWQVLEYSCTWKIFKSSAELRNFDRQLRLLFDSSMHNIAFPSSSIGDKLQHLHLSQNAAENQQRLQAYDAYLQSLLRLPAFSSFGNDASTMLDTFLDISPHFAPFRKREKESGLSMHLRDRRVVPWKDRKRFEVVYKMHVQVIEEQEEKARRAKMAESVVHRNEPSASRHRHRHHHCPEQNSNTAYIQPSKFTAACVEAHMTLLPPPMEMATIVKETRPDKSAQERVAKIGHRLVIEAFET